MALWKYGKVPRDLVTFPRTHQFNLGGYADLPLGFRIGILSHFWSPFALTPFTLPVAPPPITWVQPVEFSKPTSSAAVRLAILCL
jgi:hypothetical protein